MGWRCTSAKWHRINLTCSQVERQQWKEAHIHTREHTHTREKRRNWTGKWRGIYRKETGDGWGGVLLQDFVFGLPSRTNPCPVNFMLSSPQAKQQFASEEGSEGMVSVGNRWSETRENQTLLLYFNLIYYSQHSITELHIRWNPPVGHLIASLYTLFQILPFYTKIGA